MSEIIIRRFIQLSIFIDIKWSITLVAVNSKAGEPSRTYGIVEMTKLCKKEGFIHDRISVFHYCLDGVYSLEEKEFGEEKFNEKEFKLNIEELG